jgi:hypothetical protein
VRKVRHQGGLQVKTPAAISAQCLMVVLTLNSCNVLTVSVICLVGHVQGLAVSCVGQALLGLWETALVWMQHTDTAYNSPKA